MQSDLAFRKIGKAFPESVYHSREALIVQGDSLKLLEAIPSNVVSLILTDPPCPNAKKKSIVGDTRFSNDENYLAWMEEYAKAWKRVLKPNGSIYCFCSSAMSARLQVMFSRYFNILAEITWTKPNAPGYDGWKQTIKRESLRQWYLQSERILFMECASEGNLFRSTFGAMLSQWRKQAGLTMHQLTEIIGAYGKINHGGAVANWESGRNIPSRDQYARLRSALETKGVDGIPAYEDMIRPFHVGKDAEFTDVWTFANVRQYKGRHPAEKPVDLLTHAILSSTYDGDIVLDCFAGSGATGEACIQTHRKAVLMEMEPSWCETARSRLQNQNYLLDM